MPDYKGHWFDLESFYGKGILKESHLYICQISHDQKIHTYKLIKYQINTLIKL